jgi:hypothetical protein
MKINFYDKLFFVCYDIMSKQTSDELEFNRFSGLVFGSSILGLSIFFLIMDVVLLLKKMDIVSKIDKVSFIILIILIILVNIFYFKNKNRYLTVLHYFEEMEAETRRMSQIRSWFIVLSPIAILFVLMGR